MFPIDFLVTFSKVKVKLLVFMLLWDCFMGHKIKVKLLIFISALSVQYVIKRFLDNYMYQTWHSGCHNRVDNSLYIYATLLNFLPGVIYVSQTFFVLKIVLKWINILIICWTQVTTWWWCYPVISFISSMWASCLNLVNISCYMVSNSVPMTTE